MHSTPVKNRFFPPVILLALILASCAPAAPSADQPAVQQPAATVAVEPGATPSIGSDPYTAAAVPPTEAVASAPLPVATSRGPDLHATDPGTVSLASGQLQFLEFFRFT